MSSPSARDQRRPKMALSDSNLERIALECWDQAALFTQPGEVESVARAAVLDALVFAASKRSIYLDAQRIFEEFLKTGRHLLRRPENPFTNRLHRAIWLMAQRLFETSLYDPRRRCASMCQAPDGPHARARCPAVDDPSRTECVRSLVFPYLKVSGDSFVPNVDKTAKAIVKGFELADIRQTNGDPYWPSPDAVRKVIARFPRSH